jgi:hypothetical protein
MPGWWARRNRTGTPQLRARLTARDARDILRLCSSPELYELLVKQRG